MSFKFTDSEVEILILIFEGWQSGEIAKFRNMSIEDFDEMMRALIKKTRCRTWEELAIIGSQLSHALDHSLSQAQDAKTGTLFEIGTKEIFEFLIEQAYKTLKDHKETCFFCKHGFQINCPDQKRLDEKILEWTGNRNIFEAQEKEKQQ